MADVDKPLVKPGDVVTVTVSALMDHDTPFFALNAFELAALVHIGADLGSIQSVKVLNDLNSLCGQCGPEWDQDDIWSVGGGQLTVFGPFTSDNPIDVFEMRWQAEAPGEVSYDTATEFAWIWAGDDKESAVAVDITDVAETSFGWTVVPAPGAALTIGITFAAMRRRRQS